MTETKELFGIHSNLFRVMSDKLNEIYKRFNEIVHPLELSGQSSQNNEVIKALNYVVFGERK